MEEQPRGQEALAATETKFSDKMELSLVGAYLIQDGKFLYVNPRLAEIFGYTPEELILHMAPENLVAEGDRSLVVEQIHKHLEGEIPSLEYCFRGLRKDGRVINIEAHASHIEFNGRPAVIGTFTDISPLVQGMVGLRRREAILEAVTFAAERFLRTPDWEHSIQEVLEYLGKATRASRVIFFENFEDADGGLMARDRYEWTAPGITPSIQIPTFQVFSWNEPAVRPIAATLRRHLPVSALVRELPKSEQKFFDEREIKALVGVPVFVGQEWWGFLGIDECLAERHWSWEEVAALKAAAGIVGGAIQRRRAEVALENQQNLLKTIFNATPDLIGLKDRDLSYRAVNPAFCRFLGKTEEEVLGRKDEDLFPAEEALVSAAEDLQAVEEGTALIKDVEVTGADGKKWLQVVKTPIRDSAGTATGLLYSGRDISVRKRAMGTLREHKARLREIIAEYPQDSKED